MDHLPREELLRLMEQLAGRLGVSQLNGHLLQEGGHNHTLVESRSLTSSEPEESREQGRELEQVEEELQEWEEVATPPGAEEEAEEEVEKEMEELVYDEDDDNDDIEPVTKKASSGRGKNLKWTVCGKFASKIHFQISDVKAEIDRNFKPRKVRSTEYSEKALFECRFHRKTHFKSCPVKYQVNYSNSSDEVIVANF